MPLAQYRISGRAPGPIAQALALITTLVVLAASIVLGAFLIAAIIGFAFVLGLAAWLRLWWLSRKAPPAPGRATGEVIEAEYRVVREARTRAPGEND